MKQFHLKTPAAMAEPPKTKEEHKKTVAKKIDDAVGRPPANAKEKRLRSAATGVLTGEKHADMERLYAVTQTELQRYMKQVFPTEEDRFEFLQECAITNATLAMGRFQQCFGELSAIDAARAFQIFTGQALAIKKARTTDFKDPGINVETIINLQNTLNKIAIQPAPEPPAALEN